MDEQLLETGRAELRRHKDTYNLDFSIADLAPTLCALAGVPMPSSCCATPIACVVDQASHLMGGVGKAEKLLVFCPDAIGEHQRELYPEQLARVKRLAGFEIKSAGVMPSVTPVCFGSIFSGASPEVHGIKEYARPVLSVETVFDTFPKAGRKACIISRDQCSMDMIFRQRDVDYLAFGSDERAFRATELAMEQGDYDLIVSYMMDYDESGHHHGPWAPESVAQLRLAVERFERLVQDTETHWKEYNRLVAFLPDHGQHPIDSQTGGHGADIPDDMRVDHYYRVRGK